MEHLQNCLDTSEHVRFRAAQRREADYSQLLLNLTNVVSAKCEIMNEIARAFFVQRALCKLRFEVAFETKQIRMNCFQLTPQPIRRLPIAARCKFLTNS